MPISPIVLQRRHAELGRIRLGDKGAKGQPQKLTVFRFTSGSQRHIEDIAKLYGGEARPWKNGNRQEWEVYTEAKSIPVIVVKGGISQWLETWSGGGCVHRCDGVTNVLTDERCDPDDPKHKAAKPTTRLSVMLRQLDAIGVFRLESHGWNAAAELPGLVEIAMHVGEFVPANLYLAERVAIKDGKTSRFVVPGLDLEVAPGRLAEIVSGKAQGQIGGTASDTKQIEAAPTDYATLIAEASTIEDLQTLWHRAGQAGELTDDLKEQIKARGAELENPAPLDEPVDAVVDPTDYDEDEVSAAWMNVVTVAGQHGWTLYQLEDAFQRFAAAPVSEASTQQVSDFLAALRRGEVEAPAAVGS